jgi:hypothetical protein
MRRQAIALRSMSKEARQLASLIAAFRKSLHDLGKQRALNGLSTSDIAVLDKRRSNLMLTIAALEDRLSAMQGLIDRGRPHIIRVH